MPKPQNSSPVPVLQTLAWLRRQNFKPVALRPQSKAALDRHYVESAYSPPSDDFWKVNNYGVGVVTGPVSSGPVDVDLDCSEAIFFAPRFLPPTPAIFGRKSKPSSHYFYRSASPAFGKQALIDPMMVSDKTIIELRGDGGHQTVLPGNQHETTGELIEWTTVPFPDVPTVEDELLTRAVKKVAIATLLARHVWLDGARNEAVKCISGMFFYLGWTCDEVIELVTALDNFSDSHDKTHVLTVVNTYKKAERGAKIIGATSLRKLLRDDRVVDRLLEWAGSATVNILEEFNARYASVTLDGHFRIADTSTTPLVFFQKDDFFNRHIADYVTIDGKPVPKAKLWLHNPRHRDYDSAEFLPGVEDPPRILNTWPGWAIQPDPQAICAAWNELLFEIVCGRDDELHRWVLNWFANIVREPLRKPMTALVIIGQQGAGKSLLVDYLGRILGQSYVVVTNEEHVYGRFNKHLGSALLLHSEEALYGGDKKHRGIIKSLISDNWRMFEQKGIDARQVRNYLRLILTSNEPHAAPVEVNDRRFTVIDMDKRIISPKLIDAIVKEMEGLGPAALFHQLLTMDYDPVIPRTNIKNEAQAAVRSAGMSPMEEWWLATLTSGRILPDYLMWAQRPTGDKHPWPEVVASPSLHMSMVIYVEDGRLRGQLPGANSFNDYLSKMTGRKKWAKRQVDYVNPQLEGIPMRAKTLSSRQNSITNLPTLDECRKAFSLYLGGRAIDWPEDAAEDEKPIHERY